jgi:hypothetical protein
MVASVRLAPTAPEAPAPCWVGAISISVGGMSQVKVQHMLDRAGFR